MEKRILTVATDAQIDLSRTLLPPNGAVHILLNFRWDLPPLGIGRLYIEDDKIQCELILQPDVNEDMILDCWPAIAGRMVFSPNSNYVTAGRIEAIGIGTDRPKDQNIRTLREQWNLPPKPKIIT